MNSDLSTYTASPTRYTKVNDEQLKKEYSVSFKGLFPLVLASFPLDCALISRRLVLADSLCEMLQKCDRLKIC